MKDYEVLVSKLREKPTINSQEEVIRKDFKLKLPDRRGITLWNTPEISQFRGYQESLDETEDRKHVIQVEQIGIQQAAREANNPESLQSMQMVNQMRSEQRQSAAAMAQHMSDLATQTRQEAARVAAEQRAELVRLGQAQAEAANRQRIAETALSGLSDHAEAHRREIAELAARAGHVTQNIDQRHFETHNHNTTNNTTNNTMNDQNVHNMAVNYMQAHTQQLAVYANQHQVSQENMLRGIYQLFQQQQRQQAQIAPNIVLHMTPPSTQPPQAAIMAYQPPQQPPGPPPPPAGGVIAAAFKPVPEPAPMVKPAPVIRRTPRARSASPRGPYSSTKKAAKVTPWNSGIIVQPTVPQATPKEPMPLPAPTAPPVVTPPIPIPQTPDTTAILPPIATPAPAPKARGRPPRSIGSASTRAPSSSGGGRSRSVETTRTSTSTRSRASKAPGEAAAPPPQPADPPKKKIVIKPVAKAVGSKKKVSISSKVEMVDPEPSKPIVIRPVAKPMAKKRSLSTAYGSKVPPGPSTRLAGEAVVGPGGVVTRRVRVVPLRIQSSGEYPRRRGRPKGSLGAKQKAKNELERIKKKAPGSRSLDEEMKLVNSQQL